jgi:hypothetical protein
LMEDTAEERLGGQLDPIDHPGTITWMIQLDDCLRARGHFQTCRTMN